MSKTPYDERMPVIAFRASREVKDFLEEKAVELNIPVQKLCRMIVNAYFNQHDMFEINLKDRVVLDERI